MPTTKSRNLFTDLREGETYILEKVRSDENDENWRDQLVFYRDWHRTFVGGITGIDLSRFDLEAGDPDWEPEGILTQLRTLSQFVSTIFPLTLSGYVSFDLEFFQVTNVNDCVDKPLTEALIAVLQDPGKKLPRANSRAYRNILHWRKLHFRVVLK